jgi:hypothetical protein
MNALQIADDDNKPPALSLSKGSDDIVEAGSCYWIDVRFEGDDR